MSRHPARAATQFFGGRICLDFANTVDWRTSNQPQELMADYEAFIGWSSRRGTLPARAATKLKSRAAADPIGAKAVMADATALRTELWRIADALREQRAADLSRVNRMLVALPPQPRLIRHENDYMHELKGTDLREPLWPILWSLTAVLSSADASRVGCCQASGCGWFYVDESPNRTRLWCSSEVCGNRERARRAYAKRSSKH